MTKTEEILRNFLFLSMGGVALACAGPEKEGGNYCFNINEGDTCPSMETVNAEKLPYEPQCSTIEYLEATSEAEQSDSPVSGMMAIPDDEGDSCCYEATYRELRDQAECAIGRPLMEEGRAKLAKTKRAIDNPWRGALPRVRSTHSPDKRLAAGQFYLLTALYEHASVASFQKFGMELMRFGAPPQLLDRAQMAARDEIRHAQMAFAIAADLLGAEVQPDNLDYNPVLSKTLREFAKATLTEGAMGETLAVLLAVEQLQHTDDPAIRAFLEQVVAEEAQHAELAWETLRWCLQQDPSILSVVEEAIAKGPQIALDHYPESPIEGLGLPSRSSMAAAVERGFVSVILPSLESLREIAA